MTPLSGSFQICYIQSPVNSTILKKLQVTSSTRHSRPRSRFLKPTIFALLAFKYLISSATRLRWFAVTSSSSSFLSLRYVLQKHWGQHLRPKASKYLRPSVWVPCSCQSIVWRNWEQIVNHLEGFQPNILCWLKNFLPQPPKHMFKIWWTNVCSDAC